MMISAVNELDASKTTTQIGGALVPFTVLQEDVDMTKGAPGFFDVGERLAKLSAKGDDLQRVNALVDFELFGSVSITLVSERQWRLISP